MLRRIPLGIRYWLLRSMRVCDAAFGCAYPPAPHGTHIIAVSHDTIKIRCNVSRESWTLKCEPSGQQWTGTTGNCTASTFFLYSYSLSLSLSLSLCGCVMSLRARLLATQLDNLSHDAWCWHRIIIIHHLLSLMSCLRSAAVTLLF